LAPKHDNPALSTAQDFDYSDELKQERCPYAAHIRYYLFTRLKEIEHMHAKDKFSFLHFSFFEC
jgi:hypothetical protein